MTEHELDEKEGGRMIILREKTNTLMTVTDHGMSCDWHVGTRLQLPSGHLAAACAYESPKVRRERVDLLEA